MCNTCGGPNPLSRNPSAGGSLKNIRPKARKASSRPAGTALAIAIRSFMLLAYPTQAPRPRSKHRHSQSHRASARSEQSILARKVPTLRYPGRQDYAPRSGSLGKALRLERHIEVSANSCYSCYTLALSNDNRRLHKWRNVTRRRPSAKNPHLCNQSITNQPPRDILGRESIARSTSTNAKAN